MSTLSDLITSARTGPVAAAFDLAESLVDAPEPDTQTMLADALFTLGKRDPEALSVFLAAHAHTLPRATILAAGKALPEAG